MSDVIRDIANYPMSEDYKLLWELAQIHSVVCEVDYDFRNSDPADPIRDIAATRCHQWHGSTVVEIGVRGYGYIDADGEDDFFMQCRRSHVKFILPSYAASDPNYFKAKLAETKAFIAANSGDQGKAGAEKGYP